MGSPLPPPALSQPPLPCQVCKAASNHILSSPQSVDGRQIRVDQAGKSSRGSSGGRGRGGFSRGECPPLTAPIGANGQVQPVPNAPLLSPLQEAGTEAMAAAVMTAEVEATAGPGITTAAGERAWGAAVGGGLL